jgi:hypothetical protein
MCQSKDKSPDELSLYRASMAQDYVNIVQFYLVDNQKEKCIEYYTKVLDILDKAENK